MRCQPYWYFGEHDAEGFTRPLRSAAFLDRFRTAFGITRREEPGCRSSSPTTATSTGARTSCARSSGTVEDEGGQSVLDRNGIEQAVSDPELARLRPLVALARWGLGLGDGHRVPRVEAPPAGAAPKWSDGLMAAEDVEPLRADFEAGREVAVDVGLWVHPSKRTVDAVQTTFRVLMQREDEHLRGSGQFVRRGITIENPKARRPPGVRWIVEVDDQVLSRFLGDAENPAHTEWQRSSPKSKDR